MKHPRKSRYLKPSNSNFFCCAAPQVELIGSHSPGDPYAAVNGCRCVVKIRTGGKVETVLKSEKPWSPTGVAVRGKDVFGLEYHRSNFTGKGYDH
jgi:hypothetical protein